jgi:hypothetical protein
MVCLFFLSLSLSLFFFFLSFLNCIV